MRIPALGPRGEGWVLAQLALAALIVGAGIAGPPWLATPGSLRVVAGILIGIAVMYLTGLLVSV
jgi:hypothetical protein